MFGSIGIPELIVILVIALIVFGPGKLPDVGKSIGEAIRGFRKAMSEPERPPPRRAQGTGQNRRVIKARLIV
jgi:TatA/E family protein of Tat protein translocase